MGREQAFLAPAILAGCGVAVGVGFAAPVLGEEARAAAIEEIVVTARRREESIQSVPIAVTALDSRALEFSGIEEVEDIELGVPGLQVSTGTFRKSTPALSIRGLSGGALQLSEDP
jgi:iron complex outermembrane receptor protein